MVRWLFGTGMERKQKSRQETPYVDHCLPTVSSPLFRVRYDIDDPFLSHKSIFYDGNWEARRADRYVFRTTGTADLRWKIRIRDAIQIYLAASPAFLSL